MHDSKRACQLGTRQTKARPTASRLPGRSCSAPDSEPSFQDSGLRKELRRMVSELEHGHCAASCSRQPPNALAGSKGVFKAWRRGAPGELHRSDSGP